MLSSHHPQLEPLPVFAPSTGIHTLKAVADALDVGWLGMGAFTKEFEERIGDFLGLDGRYVVATNTGTSALHMALVLAGVGSGDEVIVPSFNYVADMQAITTVGAVPVFCDIRADDLGVDCERVEALITPRTRAIMPLHFAGMSCDIEGVYDVADRHGLRVIEDAMHAFGTIRGGRKIGSFGDLSCFSFDAVKIVTTLDGGAVICGSKDELEHLQRLRLLGIDKDTSERYKNTRAWEYDVLSHGFRYHLTNVNASIGLSQLARIDGFMSSRQETCRLYNAAFESVPGITTPQTNFRDVSPFIYVIRVRPEWRLELIAHLRSLGIATGIHFLPAHKFSFYASSPRGPLPVTEQVTQEVVTLPLHSHMPRELAERVIHGVRDFAQSRRTMVSGARVAA
jgi:dTDP-4-amino-4,6-dideoxygalactose transaminase